MKVILDNGHGIDTPGKRSPIWEDGSQLLEYKFNRAVVEVIKAGLDLLRIPNILLVPELYDIHLIERVERANRIYKEENGQAFLVSVHANAAPTPGTGQGWEIFTSKGQTQSDLIATYFFDQARNLLNNEIRLRQDDSDGDPDKEANFFILKRTLCPAVLTENLFMDNERESKYLMSEEGVQAIARIHINAIENYINDLKNEMA